MDETIASTINQKEDSESMKIDGKESTPIFYMIQPNIALGKGLKIGDFYNNS